MDRAVDGTNRDCTHSASIYKLPAALSWKAFYRKVTEGGPPATRLRWRIAEIHDEIGLLVSTARTISRWTPIPRP